MESPASLHVVFFELRGRRCALPVEVVREVAEMPHVTPVPLAGPVVRGLVPVHGQALPLIDLGEWFATRTREAHVEDAQPARGGDTRLLVLEAKVGSEPSPVRAGLSVDRVLKVGPVTCDEAWSKTSGPRFVSASVVDGEGPALLLDAATALAMVMESVREGSTT